MCLEEPSRMLPIALLACGLLVGCGGGSGDAVWIDPGGERYDNHVRLVRYADAP